MTKRIIILFAIMSEKGTPGECLVGSSGNFLCDIGNFQFGKMREKTFEVWDQAIMLPHGI